MDAKTNGALSPAQESPPRGRPPIEAEPWASSAPPARKAGSNSEPFTGWRPDGCGRIALILQGGGALGAYQAGVYEALHEYGIEPDWITGVSIGAINAAIIAGNTRANRLERLKVFWSRITERKIWHHTPDGDIFRQMRNATSAMMTMTQGQSGFFKPTPSVPGSVRPAPGQPRATTIHRL